MTSSQPNQPLTDAELESYRQGFSGPYDGHVIRLLDEVDRLRAELDRARKKIKGLREECDRYAIRAHERFRALDQDGEVQPAKRAEPDPVHFAPYGGAFTTCGRALSGISPWSAAQADFSSPTLTTRREKATCNECIAALGLDQDGNSNG